MKKVFITLAVVLMSMTTVNAQLVIGGGFGIGGDAGTITKVDGESNNRTNSSFSFDVAPKVGYMLMNGKMEVGAMLSLNYAHNTSYKVLQKAYKDQRNYNVGLSVVPYARYYFLQKGCFNLGVEADLQLGGNFITASKYYATDGLRTQVEADAMMQAEKKNIKDASPTSFNWAFGVMPVFMFNLTEHCYMDIAVNALGLSIYGNVNSAQMKLNNNQTIKVKTSSFAGGLNLMNQVQDILKVGFAYKF